MDFQTSDTVIKFEKPEGQVSAFSIILEQRKAEELRQNQKRQSHMDSIKFNLQAYLLRFQGTREGIFPPKPNSNILFWSFVASFIGIAVCAVFTYNVVIYPGGMIDGTEIQLTFLIGSFGATAVLIFGTVDSPLAQPRNLLLGHLLSAVVGVGVAEGFALRGYEFPNNSDLLWLECALAVSLSIFVMQVLRIVHPPGGATALIAVTSTPGQRMHGLYILIPVMGGVLAMLVIALVVNNITRQYPSYWWKPDVKDIPVREGSTHHSSQRYGEAFSAADEGTTHHMGMSVHGGSSIHPVRSSYNVHGEGISGTAEALLAACQRIAALEEELAHLKLRINREQ